MRFNECSKYFLGFHCFKLCGRPITLFLYAQSLFLKWKSQYHYSCIEICSFIQSTYSCIVKIVCVWESGFIIGLISNCADYFVLLFLHSFVIALSHGKGQVSFVRCHKTYYSSMTLWNQPIFFCFSCLLLNYNFRWKQTMTFFSKPKKNEFQMTWFSGST